MEKVKIKSVLNSGRKWQDKDIFMIELEDGRKGTSFENAANWSGEMELEIKEGKEYQGVKQLIFNTVQKKEPGKFPVKDYTFEKRKSSLDAAITYIGSDLTSGIDAVIEVAEKFYEYLNKK